MTLRYINDKGEITENRPDDVVDFSSGYTGKIIKYYEINVFSLDSDILKGTEILDNKPTDGELLFIIIKYGGFSAEIIEMYRPETVYDIAE